MEILTLTQIKDISFYNLKLHLHGNNIGCQEFWRKSSNKNNAILKLVIWSAKKIFFSSTTTSTSIDCRKRMYIKWVSTSKLLNVRIHHSEYYQLYIQNDVQQYFSISVQFGNEVQYHCILVKCTNIIKPKNKKVFQVCLKYVFCQVIISFGLMNEKIKQFSKHRVLCHSKICNYFLNIKPQIFKE